MKQEESLWHEKLTPKANQTTYLLENQNNHQVEE